LNMGYIHTREVSRTQLGALWLGALKQARTACRQIQDGGAL